MTNQTWSWTLAALGVTCLYLISRKTTRTWGWAGAAGIQVLWIIYAIATRQWGFIASAVAYGVMYVKNLFAWHTERLVERDEPRS